MLPCHVVDREDGLEVDIHDSITAAGNKGAFYHRIHNYRFRSFGGRPHCSVHDFSFDFSLQGMTDKGAAHGDSYTVADARESH